MIKNKFIIKKDQLIIKGCCYRPNKNGKYPVIILSHELGTNMISTSRYAKKLSLAGYIVLIFDFTGSGSGISRGRQPTEMSVLTETEDLSYVVTYAKNLPFVDKRHIILGGCSQGGLVTALLAAQMKDEIEKIFLYYPGLCIPDDARKGSIAGKKIDVNNIPDKFTARFYIRVGKKYVIDAQSLEPWREICSYDKPVLICHGVNDKIVKISYAREASKRYPNCKLVEFKGVRHIFLSHKCINRAVKETIEFLR
ncbi:MAG: alpha/beta hydrolase [Peptostreptococcaceae bacterium]